MPTKQSLAPVAIHSNTAVSVSEKHVLAACKAAADAERDCTDKAVIAGMMLMEYREVLKTFHDGTSCTSVQWNNPNKPQELQFDTWLKNVGIPKTTAWRWMQAAERVARHQLNIPTAFPFTPAIDVEGVAIPLSQALTAPESELPDQAKEFRQGVFDFLADKTLGEAARAALAGESPAHRITRAAAGKSEGGSRGEDRKAWHTFIAEKLSDISGHLTHWRSFSTTQKEATEEAVSRALEKWPTPLLEHLQRQLKAELQRR